MAREQMQIQHKSKTKKHIELSENLQHNKAQKSGTKQKGIKNSAELKEGILFFSCL